MSSNVSDQIKIPGSTAKSVEERNIPWSQQVDEASYENLSSPTSDENKCSYQNSMKFQFPPFNAKESENVCWSTQKSKKTNNTDSNKKYGKQAPFNNTKREDLQPNTWGNQKKGKQINEHPLNNNNRSIRMDSVFETSKSVIKAVMNTSSDEKRVIAPPVSAVPKKTTWASIASQPAKLASRTNLSTLSHKKKGPGMPPPPMVPGKHNLDVNAWESPNNNPPSVPSPPPSTDKSFSGIDSTYSTGIGCNYDIELQIDKSHKKNHSSFEETKSSFNNSNYGRARSSPVANPRKSWTAQPIEASRELRNSHSSHIRRAENSIGNVGYQNRRTNYARAESEFISHDIRGSSLEKNTAAEDLIPGASNAVLEKLHDKNNYNPLEIDLSIASSARFFVIKSYSEDDIHRSIKYEIWCSTDHGNKRLDEAFKERQREGGQILLFFSVNGSGHFCGMARMMTAVDYNCTSSVWSQDKWKGKFKVKWVYVKDVPNIKLRHIRLENNDNKSVTNSRDTQEVPNAKGIEVLQILHCFNHTTSIFDDFYHYEKKQEEEVSRKPSAYDNLITSPVSKHYNRQSDDRDRERDSRGVSGSQKYFIGGSTSFRERKNSYRGSFHNSFNDQRRNENYKMTSVPDPQQKERDDRSDGDINKDHTDYINRHKFDYSQRLKHNREHDLSERDARFRTQANDVLKDNEYDY